MGNRKSVSKTKSKEVKDDNVIKSNYFPKGGYSTTEHKLDPIARILLMGVYDDDHALSIFRGMRYIIKNIWSLVIQFNHINYAKYIEISNPEYYKELYYREKPFVSFREVDTFQSEGRCGTPQTLNLKFPKPLKKEVNINMMPILMSEDSYRIKKQLPDNLEGYVDWIKACLVSNEWRRLKGKICYVTIHESFVKKGKTQRRPGLHIEAPGNIGYGVEGEINAAWGGGYNYEDGIYIASNISGSCVAWNCRILDDKYITKRWQTERQKWSWLNWDKMEEEFKENDEIEEELVVIGNLGNIEHLRGILPKDTRYELKEEKLYWMTDRTPHEALPMKENGWRQFFRLVSNKLSVWYEDHSTKNPIGIVPDDKITKIIKGNKFDQMTNV